MRFFTSAVAAALALATSVVAQTPDFDSVSTPEKDAVIPAGSTFTVNWSAPAKYDDTTISITLIGGATQGGQVPLMQLASGIKNSAKTYTWAVDASLGAEKIYGLILKSEQDPSIYQFSNPFTIKSSGSASASTSASSTTFITTSVGVKTVTLSSTPVSTSTSATPTTTSTTAVPTTSTFCNTTTFLTHKPTQVVLTSTAFVGATPSANSTSSGPATVPTTGSNAASTAGASSMALVGAMVLAYLAL